MTSDKALLSTPTTTEHLSGGLPVQAALTAFAALAGGAMAPLLPVLANTLARGRQEQRVNTALKEVNSILVSYGEQIRDLTDSQYKLINESILAILQTTDEDKLQVLRQVVRNSLHSINVTHSESFLLSRVVRDISAEEARFLVCNFRFARLQLGKASGDQSVNTLVIEANGTDELLFSGLSALGLIVPAGATMDDAGLHRFSRLAGKVVTLLSLS